MRKIIVGAFVSMDGVMQAPGGPEEDPTGGFKYGGWVAPIADVDPVFGEEVGKLFDQPFDLLLGRRTYDIFAAHWPHAEGGPYDDIARTFNRITKYVATRKGEDLTWKGSVALRDAAKDVAKLKQEDGPALVTQGSTEVVHALLAAGLVDEIRLFTFPILLGKGKCLFAKNSEPGAFKLTHSVVSPAGLIHAIYVRDGEVKTATIGGAEEPSPAELARREKLKREGLPGRR
ncbi:MAG: deaminase [Xanthobacteraceae bacterium]|nr:MAG: deaminase [Xanthobacteraceae bacterium]